MSTNNSDGNFTKNSNQNLNNLNQIKFDKINKSTSIDPNQSNQGYQIRKFSDNSMMRRSAEKRSTNINRIKQNEKIREGEKSKNFDMDKIIKIDFMKSFSVK